MVINKYLAELVGTFILVFIGSMSIVGAHLTGAPILVVVPLGFGLALLAGIYSVGHVSGAHFNPAVSLGMFLDRRLSFSDLIGYWIAQIVGAIIASGVVLAAADKAAVRSTVTSYGSNGAGVGLTMEFVLTLIFVLVILAVTKKAPNVAGVAIALTLTAVHLAGIPFSGSSVNPARSFGPALMGGDFNGFWVYVVGPLAGGAIAWVFWRMFGGEEEAA